MSGLGIAYLILIIAMLAADLQYVSWLDFTGQLSDPAVRFSTALSLITATLSGFLALWVAVPTGYVLSRLGSATIEKKLARRPWAKHACLFLRRLVDSLMDIPIFLPPLVIGISLLVLFQTPPGRWLDSFVAGIFAWLGYPGIRGITYEIPAIILAQFIVAAAFAIRAMRITFEQIDPRPEEVARTLGASRFAAFWRVALPQSRRGMVAAFTLAWARSIGEFGPVLIFAGTARMKTEVLPTTVYLNFQFGNLSGAVAASLLLVSIALVLLITTRIVGLAGVGNGERA